MATMIAKKTLTTEVNDLELAGQSRYLFEKLEKIRKSISKRLCINIKWSS